MERWATFDCYGTLIDWNRGIREAIGEDLLHRYHEVEPQVEAEDPALSYREVLTETARRIGADDPAALAESLPGWPVFPEVTGALERARRGQWKLAILSNTDRDYIDASLAAIGVPFDLVIVAGEIGSYKPAHGHWHAFEQAVGRLPDVHVAASHFHDVVPATALGLKTIWINRLGEELEPEPTRELPNLSGLAEALDELAPAAP
jgi:2-haloacid dehalogenase